MSNTTLNSLHVVESPAPRSGKVVQNRLDWYKPGPVDLRNRGTTARENVGLY